MFVPSVSVAVSKALPFPSLSNVGSSEISKKKEREDQSPYMLRFLNQDIESDELIPVTIVP